MWNPTLWADVLICIDLVLTLPRAGECGECTCACSSQLRLGGQMCPLWIWTHSHLRAETRLEAETEDKDFAYLKWKSQTNAQKAGLYYSDRGKDKVLAHSKVTHIWSEPPNMNLYFVEGSRGKLRHRHSWDTDTADSTVGIFHCYITNWGSDSRQNILIYISFILYIGVSRYWTLWSSLLFWLHLQYL